MRGDRRRGDRTEEWSHGKKGHLETDVEDVERVDQHHDDVGQCQRVERWVGAQGEQYHTVDAEHGGCPDGTGWESDKDDVCPDDGGG